jgi:hypothetical protein
MMVVTVAEQQSNPAVGAAIAMIAAVALETIGMMTLGDGQAAIFIFAVGAAAVGAILLAARSRSKGVVITVGILAFVVVPIVLFGVLLHVMANDPS